MPSVRLMRLQLAEQRMVVGLAWRLVLAVEWLRVGFKW